MIAKILTFQHYGASPPTTILKGLIVGSSLMAGSFVGKAVLQRMSIYIFQNVLDVLLLCSGLSLLWAAFF